MACVKSLVDEPLVRGSNVGYHGYAQGGCHNGTSADEKEGRGEPCHLQGQRAKVTDQKDPGRVQLQADQRGDKYPLPAPFVCEGAKGNGKYQAWYGVESVLPTKDHGQLLLHLIDLTFRLGHVAIRADLGGVVLLVVAETDVGFENACLGGLCEEGADIDNGDEREGKEDQPNPWFLLGRLEGRVRQRRGRARFGASVVC